MKITTIVRMGQDRAAVVLDLAQSNPNLEQQSASSDAFGPPAGHNRFYVDITSALNAVADIGKKEPGLVGLASGSKPFITVRQLISGGEDTLEMLQELNEKLTTMHLRGDGELAAASMIPETKAHVRTPVPDCPLYLVCHSNNPIPWRKQLKADAARHIAQIPSVRVRTVNSLLGQNETLILPPGFKLSMGTEFGFVIGREAESVKADDALRHVAGYVCTNDCYSGVFLKSVDSLDDPPYALTSNVQTADKCVDGCGPVGPWIATADEVGNPHDLIALTRQDGVLRDRAHTGSYIRGVEETVEWLSHLMTLPSGTIVSLGASGWDGFLDEPADRESGQSILEAEIEKVGILRTHIRYPRSGQKLRSPYFAVGTIDDSSPFDRLLEDRSTPDWPVDSAIPDLPAPSTFWMLIGNQKDSETLEPERVHSDEISVPMPLSGGCLEVSRPRDTHTKIELPSGSGRISAACHLAVVVGPDAVYGTTPDKARGSVAGHALLLSVHDSGPLDGMELPMTVFERRWALFLGYLGDGKHVLGPVTAGYPDGIFDMQLAACGETSEGSSSWYSQEAAEVLANLSRAVTLLPGDVVALGPLGERVGLTVDADCDVKVDITCDGLPSLQAVVSKKKPSVRLMTSPGSPVASLGYA